MSSNLANSLHWAREGGAVPSSSATSGLVPPTAAAGDTTTTMPSTSAQHHAAQSSNSTFYRSASITINEPIGSMSLSPANRDVVLAARKGLYIVDLESPFAPPRFLAQLSSWEAADVQWSPHPARSHWVASTSNDRLLIWNLNRPEGAPRKLPPFMAESGVSGGISASGGTKMARGLGTGSMTSAHSAEASMGPVGQSSSPYSTTNPLCYYQASTSSLRSSAIEYVLQAHTRAITDINFSAHHPDILASCAIDAWSWVWDLRTPGKPVQGYSAWNAGATQVKWNRSTPHRLATAVANKVLVWDDRKGALPLTTIEAHENMIYGLDWSRDTTSAGLDQLITCSLDGAVKWWDLSSPASKEAIAARTRITEPEQVIQTATPIARARHLPFGRGVMTLPQRGDNTLSMWARDQDHQSEDGGPVERFVGHRDVVKEYLIRTRGGSDEEHDDRRFQLITWSKDQTLRLWPISEETMAKVGHKPGGKIKVLQTRRNAKNISYRDPPALTSSSSGQGQGQGAVHPAGPPSDAATTTAAVAGSSFLLPDGSPSFHRSSIMPPPDATAALLGARGSGIPRLGGPRSPASSGGIARSHEEVAGTPVSFGSRMGGGAVGNRFSTSAGGAAAGGGEGFLSKSYPKNASFREKAAVTFGERPTPRLRKRGSSGGSGSLHPPSQPTTGTLHPKPPRPSRKDSSRSHGSSGTKTIAPGAVTPLSAGAKLRADQRRSRRLAHGAAATYMTRGAGNNAAGAADLLLRHHLRIGGGAGTGGAMLGSAATGAPGGSSSTAAANADSTDAVTWIAGVRVEKDPRRSKSEDVVKAEERRKRRAARKQGGGGGGAAVVVKPGLLTRGLSDTATIRAANMGRGSDGDGEHADESRGASSSSSSHSDGDSDSDEFDLQREVIDVAKTLPHVTIEKVDLSSSAKRSCVLSLYGPWAHGRGRRSSHTHGGHGHGHEEGTVFLRLDLTFPPTYPTSPPKYDLEHNASVTLRTRAFLLRGLATILAECSAARIGCMVPCARFLEGQSSIELENGVVVASAAVPVGEDEDEIEEGEEEEDQVGDVGRTALPGARCGASWGPQGQLVVFQVAPRVPETPSTAPTIPSSTEEEEPEGGLRALPPPVVAAAAAAAATGSGGATDLSAPTSADVTRPPTVGSVQGGPAGTWTSRRARGGADGHRFLRSYAEITAAMESLTRMGNDDRKGGDEEKRETALSPQLAATAAEPELLALMSNDFLARRLQARSVSNSSKAQQRAQGADGGTDEGRGRQGRAAPSGGRSRSIAPGGGIAVSGSGASSLAGRSRSVVVTSGIRKDSGGPTPTSRRRRYDHHGGSDAQQRPCSLVKVYHVDASLLR